jgi:hypothetical protein
MLVIIAIINKNRLTTRINRNPRTITTSTITINKWYYFGDLKQNEMIISIKYLMINPIIQIKFFVVFFIYYLIMFQHLLINAFRILINFTEFQVWN